MNHRTVHRTAAAAFLATVFAFSLPAAAVPVAGGRETFPTLENADAWSVYDDATGDVFYGFWEEDDDPWLSFNFEGDAFIWFFANEDVANGAFLGNYASQGIIGVQVEVYLSDLDEFESLDCALYTNGPEGEDYYYSDFFTVADFDDGPGWYVLTFYFDTEWYSYDSTTGEYTAFEPGTGFLTNIQELGFRFFPEEGIEATSFAGIDNVYLIPTVAAPAVTPGYAAGEFTLTFPPAPGVEYAIQSYDPVVSPAWTSVEGQSGLTGQSPITFRMPVVGATRPRGLFRVSASEHITNVITPP